MLLAFVVATALALIVVAGWWLTTAIQQRWRVLVQIPRAARRECARIDDEYRDLLKRSHHRPN